MFVGPITRAQAPGVPEPLLGQPPPDTVERLFVVPSVRQNNTMASPRMVGATVIVVAVVVALLNQDNDVPGSLIRLDINQPASPG